MTDTTTTSPELPRALGRTIRTIDSISIWSGRLFAWLAIPLIGSLVYEVASRYLLGAPTLWAFDVTYMLYGSHFMLVAAYTLYNKGHIRTDFVYRLLTPQWQGIVDSLLYALFFLPAMAVFLWFSFDFAYSSWIQGERSNLSPWLPPIYPLKTVLPMSAALLLLQGISELLKSLYAARHGRWL